METLSCPHCSETLEFKDFVTITAPPPFVPEEFLESNHLLPGFDSHSIHSNIEVATHYLQTVETVLARVELLRNDLEEARSRTQKHIAQQRECIGIGRGFPLDVHRNIFQAVTDFFPDEHAFRADQCLAVVRLSSVSRTWRKVSLEFPSIWSDIVVPISYVPRALAGRADLLDLFLKRSRESLLRVSFHFPGIGDDDDDDVWDRYKDIFFQLAGHSSRWEKLVLEGIPYELLNDLCPLSEVLQLESLEIRLENLGTLMYFPRVLISDAPSLQSIRLSVFDVERFSSASLPLAQVRKLVLGYMWSPSRYILTLLLDIPLLEELVLDQWVY
ncbi:hypothetical protein DL96DRAFT_701564 [Flagelloscypha sp. PMI_526]|nr:hypothetical protein DL96DRAFT_701564 [Flagelloscypha sp. PMI_526]